MISTSFKKHFTGKIVWLSGAQGMGKSTSAQILARDHGYVYYEADCFSMLKNPFNDVHAEEPSKNIVKLKTLKGIDLATDLYNAILEL